MSKKEEATSGQDALTSLFVQQEGPEEVVGELSLLLPDDGAPLLLRRYSEFSVSSDYDYSSPNNLTVFQAAALLTAEQMGTGILALPGDIHALGLFLGLGFLIFNLPINLFAGYLLADTASNVEQKQRVENRIYTMNFGDWERDEDGNYRSINNPQYQQQRNNNTVNSTFSATTQHTKLHHDTATFDFIGMATSLFQSKPFTRMTMVIYYSNLFLVLGNYILVMSHAIQAVIPTLCLPYAGLLASTGMFLVCQFRTMAKLARTVSLLSLAALGVVVLLCLWALHLSHDAPVQVAPTATENHHRLLLLSSSILHKLSAIGGIGFACGSGKLFLNVRHEMADRGKSLQSLALSIAAFGTLYSAVILLSGSNPPSFLFDTIPDGPQRKVAGLFLWFHVCVSYAINSQAICSSMDRLIFYRITSISEAQRWMMLTFAVALSAYTVANAIPFFKDLVSLIGALTAVPLTLLLPAILYLKAQSYPIWIPTTLHSIPSYLLLVFSVIFMVGATVGAISSVQMDWATLGAPFAC